MNAIDDPVLRRIARNELPGSSDGDFVELGGRAVDDARWTELLRALVAQRLAGHAARCAEAGELVLTPAQLDELHERHEEQLAIDLRIERMLVDCDATLGRAGIETRILKGPSVAHRFYADPSLRSFGDGDILVRGNDLETVVETMAHSGFERRFAAPRGSFDRRFVKAVSVVARDGLELDVHRAMTPGPYGVLFDVDEIFATPPAFVAVGGRQLRVLDPELALAHACAHALLGDPVPRFVSVRDVAEIANHVDPGRARDVFERFRAEVVARGAVELAERVLGITLSGGFSDWAHNYAGSRVDRSRLASYAGPQPRYAAQAAATFWVLPSLRDRVAYASALAFPGRDYLDTHDTSYSRRVMRGASLVLRWRPR